MTAMIGSARHDENGKLSGGKAGDQTGQEVSTQKYYNHSKGWYGLRAKDAKLANKIAEGMKIACANNNIGYDQGQRLGVYNNGIETKVKTEGDCSELVRAILKWCGVNVKDFTTATEKSVLLATGLFDLVSINSANDCYTGDILVTKTKGHTGVVTEGKNREESQKAINPYTKPIRTLKKGMIGNDVRWVQFELKQAGYDLGKAGIDGQFGGKTDKSVRAFQEKYKLEVDGKVGKLTRDKLEEV